jgi:hypothetical protein
MNTEMDCLVVGDYFLEKEEQYTYPEGTFDLKGHEMD